MEKKGYRIEQFELALPSGAQFDRVVYEATGGQYVKEVYGRVFVERRWKHVSWNRFGQCFNGNNVHVPEWDLKLGGGEG